MNSIKLSKQVKKKVMSNFTMGQKIGISSAKSQSSSCSIYSDENVKFVVDNYNVVKCSTAVPVNKKLELSRKTYSKKEPIAYTDLSSPEQDKSDFPVLPKVKPLSSKSFLERKRKASRTFTPEKKRKESSQTLTKYFKEPKSRSKVVDHDISSDSDIEVIEVKVVNANAFNAKPVHSFASKKLLPCPSVLNNKKKDYSELPRKRNETKSLLASKPCFVTENELVVNEADTAPYMPNMFPDVSCISPPLKWLNTNGSIENSHCGTKRKETTDKNSANKPLNVSGIIQEPTEKTKSRELKNLYENLNEISWTQETSFKNLLRNPEYIRHSERSTGRVTGTGKSLRKIKQPTVKSGKRVFKKSPTIKAGLKKSKLAKVNTNKRLTKFNSNNKINKLNARKSAKDKTLKLVKPVVKEMLQIDDKSKIPKVKEINNVSKTKIVSNLEKSKLKNIKKNMTSNEKIKSKTKLEDSKPTHIVSKEKITNISKSNIVSKEKVTNISKSKAESSEASSSGISNQFCCDSPFYNSVAGTLKKFIQQEGLDARHFEMLKDFKKDNRMYTAVKKGPQCRVQIEPLEHTNLWSTEYYEDFRKQFLHQTLRKAMEKREPNSITTMLQELCDSYMMPPTDDGKVSKKKKPEEEILRSSARQIEGAFRYKEIVVKKLQDYMQVILVPNGIKKNCLSIDAIKELRDAFLLAKKDPKCRAVLLNSSGSYFCSGIDLSQLVGANKKQACEEMASVIRELVLVLGSFSKPVVAAVNGAALGFGVSLLTYCDIVLASDKATFCVPSTTIGYMPEGGLTLTLPQIVGNVRSSEMLLQGTRLTASQAHQKGLVSEVLWPTRLMNEVIPRIQSILAQPLQVMEATKLLVRANVWDKLKTHMDFERRLIVNQWLSAPCQDNIKRILRGDTLLE